VSVDGVERITRGSGEATEDLHHLRGRHFTGAHFTGAHANGVQQRELFSDAVKDEPQSRQTVFFTPFGVETETDEP
jgi:hypothetical protein